MSQPNQFKYPMEGVAGSIKIKATAVDKNDPRRHHNINGRDIYHGEPIANIRKRFGGKDEGELSDPFQGKKHLFSLKPWAGHNPDTTFLIIEFFFIPTKKA